MTDLQAYATSTIPTGGVLSNIVSKAGTGPTKRLHHNVTAARNGH